jgi:DNA mismatch repair ATPase MutS
MINSLLYGKEASHSKIDIKDKKELIDDLNLDVIFKAMSNGNNFVYKTCREVILNSLTNKDLILYRQNILKDCIENKFTVFDIYNILDKAIKVSKKYIEYTKPHYTKVITMSNKVENAIGLIKVYCDSFSEIKEKFDKTKKSFVSDGMKVLCNDLDEFLTDEFFENCNYHINYLSNASEKTFMMVSSKVGKGMKGTDYKLNKIAKVDKIKNISGLFNLKKENIIQLNSVNLMNNANEIVDGMFTHVLRVLNHSIKFIQEFLENLKFEFAFYKGAINLYEKMSRKSFHLTFPKPEESKDTVLEFEKLYDLSLGIDKDILPVDNSLKESKKNLFIVTGANQGGKSTYLRSIGISQILMQVGLFVAAKNYTSNLSGAMFTHFTKKEDIKMNSGRLDEELLRINNIVNSLNKNSMILMNESFATTTERESTIIAKDIILPLIEHDIKIIYVTHLFEFADKIYNEYNEKATFMRAVRKENGDRTFEIKENKPIYTSYGEDLYNKHIKSKMN